MICLQQIIYKTSCGCREEVFRKLNLLNSSQFMFTSFTFLVSAIQELRSVIKIIWTTWTSDGPVLELCFTLTFTAFGRTFGVQQLHLGPPLCADPEPLLHSPLLPTASLVAVVSCGDRDSCGAASCQQASLLYTPAINILPLLEQPDIHLQYAGHKII